MPYDIALVDPETKVPLKVYHKEETWGKSTWVESKRDREVLIRLEFPLGEVCKCVCTVDGVPVGLDPARHGEETTKYVYLGCLLGTGAQAAFKFGTLTKTLDASVQSSAPQGGATIGSFRAVFYKCRREPLTEAELRTPHVLDGGKSTFSAAAAGGAPPAPEANQKKKEHGAKMCASAGTTISSSTTLGRARSHKYIVVQDAPLADVTVRYASEFELTVNGVIQEESEAAKGADAAPEGFLRKKRRLAREAKEAAAASSQTETPTKSGDADAFPGKKSIVE